VFLGYSYWAWLGLGGSLLLVVWEVIAVAGTALRVRVPDPVPVSESGPAVAVLVACKGDTPHARRFFEHLMAQRYRPFRVILAVESESDTALGLLQLPGMAERTEAVVAGPALAGSQKVANVIAGLDRLRPEDAILVQADSDHEPPPDWLGRLVAVLQEEGATVVSGYRLLVPARPSLGACLTAALDNAIASAPRPPFHALCWGGCTAARRETFERLGYREALERSFNDDMLLSRLLQQARVRIAQPRDLLLPMAAEHDLRRMANFVPRQYMQVRWYAPANRWFALFLLPVPLLGWAGTIGATVADRDWGWAALAVGVAAALAKAFLRRLLVRRIAGAEALRRWRCVFWLTALAAPLLALLHCVLGYVGLFKRQVVWAGTRYRIDGPKDVAVLERRPDVPA